jgi:hypothetical protein
MEIKLTPKCKNPCSPTHQYIYYCFAHFNGYSENFQDKMAVKMILMKNALIQMNGRRYW